MDHRSFVPRTYDLSDKTDRFVADSVTKPGDVKYTFVVLCHCVAGWTLRMISE
jgi:hypothetical protein